MQSAACNLVGRLQVVDYYPLYLNGAHQYLATKRLKRLEKAHFLFSRRLSFRWGGMMRIVQISISGFLCKHAIVQILE